LHVEAQPKRAATSFLRRTRISCTTSSGSDIDHQGRLIGGGSTIYTLRGGRTPRRLASETVTNSILLVQRFVQSIRLSSA
jgi:hypothetical protein